jgi:hypothetical protein
VRGGIELPENAILLLLEFRFLLSFVRLNSFSEIRMLLLPPAISKREKVVIIPVAVEKLVF